DGPRTRLDHLRSKLLDLSLHNRLLNFKNTRKTLALQQPLDLARLEDALADGRAFRIEAAAAKPTDARDDVEAQDLL
ncbi:hypothetical protein DF186_25875, partial [Enterococcus hirae]